MITIRQLQPHESAAYRLLRLESLMLHATLFSASYADAASTKTLPFERFIQTRDADNVMFGAFVYGQLAGICGLQRESSHKARHRAQVVQLYVSQRATGRGIGAQLVDAVMHHAFAELSIEQLELGVVEHNHAAIRLYERRGFREYGRLEHYFRAKGNSSAQLLMVAAASVYSNSSTTHERLDLRMHAIHLNA